MKKGWQKFKLWIKKYRYYLYFMLICFFTWYYFALPEKIFDDPTSTVLFDRNGNLMGARIAEDGQWRFPHNDSVPEKFRKALIQFEDKNFYTHIGVSAKGFGRALVQNISKGRVVSGGSTLTMQVVRLMRKGKRRTLYEKMMEAILATRLELRFSKEEILALYASNAPMGGNVVGLDAAAWRYFGRSPDQLSWAESAMLAILPNAPSLIFPGRNQIRLKEKRNRLLDRLYEIGELDSLAWRLAKQEPLPGATPPLPHLADHLLDRSIKEGRKGQHIISSLDKNLQEQVRTIVQLHQERLMSNRIQNAACLVLDVNTGKTLAYVGNSESEDESSGSEVDIITSRRSTGSILKPLLYAGMLSDGMITPRMLMQDVPTHISGYTPKNYNRKYDGAVPANRALARSLNVPIVRMLKDYGVNRFYHLLRKLGITTLDKPASHYGLSLVLGGAEATLWDLCSIYAHMARTLNQYPDFNSNLHVPSHYLKDSIQALQNSKEPLLDPAAIWFTFQAMVEVNRPEEEANWQNFQHTSRIAWKTGTSFGFRDAWAIGITPKYVVGVWTGNADGEGRPGLTGISSSAPLLFDVFSRLKTGPWFNRPYDEMDKVAVCRQSGHLAQKDCSPVDSVWLPRPSLRTPACPYHQLVHLDKSGKFRVHSDCYSTEEMTHQSWFVLPPVVEFYYRSRNPSYSPLPPFLNTCIADDEGSPLEIIYPKQNSRIFIPIGLDGVPEKSLFEVAHRDPSAELFWHLDENFLGTSRDLHQMEVQPLPGKHKLTVIDENGNKAIVKFEVIGSQ